MCRRCRESPSSRATPSAKRTLRFRCLLLLSAPDSLSTCCSCWDSTWPSPTAPGLAPCGGAETRRVRCRSRRGDVSICLRLLLLGFVLNNAGACKCSRDKVSKRRRQRTWRRAACCVIFSSIVTYRISVIGWTPNFAMERNGKNLKKDSKIARLPSVTVTF